MALNFPSYLVKTIQFYLRCRSFEASFQAATSSRRGMRAGVAQWGLISPVLFIFNDMPVFSLLVQLALYADDTAVIATSRKPALLVKLSGVIPRRLRALVQEMKDRHERVEEHG